MSDVTQAPTVRRFGAFEINLRSEELRKNGLRLRLSGQPFQVLAALVERPGELVTREELHSKLWTSDTFVDFDHGLNNAVARIREVLDDSSDTPRFVETVPKRGYRFIAPLIDLPSSSLVDVPPIKDKSEPSPQSILVQAEHRLASFRRKMLLVGVFVLATLTIALFWYLHVSATKLSPIKSLAVLPLKNLSGDPSQEYLADGMTESLIGRLSGIHDLRVISRTSVMRFKDTQLSVPEIAKTLGVDAVVEGSVMREGNRIRVHAQLIRASSDEHFWSEAYDRELGDVLTLDSDIAQSIAGKVEVTITGGERLRLASTRHVSPEVYESYLKGMFINTNTKAGLQKRIDYFNDAINKDPGFAPAYAGLADAYSDQGSVFGGTPRRDVLPKIVAAARKAIELEPELAEAHVRLAGVLQDQWKWAEAESEYNRALELKPNDPIANLGFAYWLLHQGRMEDAITWAQRGREADPLGTAGADIGFILFHARRYDESIRELRSTLAVHPDSAVAYWFLGYALIANGQPQEAITALEKSVALTDRNPAVIAVLIRAYAHAGRRKKALELLSELKSRKRTGYIPAGVFVNAYLGLGDNEQAFVWLETAYNEQSTILKFLKTHPHFDPLRSDPRFVELIRRVGLDQQR